MEVIIFFNHFKECVLVTAICTVMSTKFAIFWLKNIYLMSWNWHDFFTCGCVWSEDSGWVIATKKMTLREKMQTRFRYTTLISGEPHGKSLRCNPQTDGPHETSEPHQTDKSKKLSDTSEHSAHLQSFTANGATWNGWGEGAEFYDDINWCHSAVEVG